MSLRLDVRHESLPLGATFTISRGSKDAADVVLVTLRDGVHRGRGECVPYPRYGESIAGVMRSIASVREQICAGADRAALQGLLPPGAARNALDCALWDLEAKRAGQRAWELAGLRTPAPVATALTLSLDTPSAMRAAAGAADGWPVLKMKLGGADDLARVRAVREGSPCATLIVDANEAWSVDDYEALAPALQALGVAMIEQPLPAGADAALAQLPHPVPVCADESCHDRDSLAALAGRYELVNVKLDKAGGLSEALALCREARRAGLGVMVGCMVASSLAMAPATLLTRGASFVDLDGPLLLREDRPHGLHYDGARVHAPDAALWG